MTPRERFRQAISFEPPADRLPMIEWAPWWDQTIVRWEREGLPAGLSLSESCDYFGLDTMVLLNGSALAVNAPQPVSHGAGIMTDEDTYEALRPYLYTDAILDQVTREAKDVAARHARGEVVVRLWLDGFFWFPRSLFGIERHLYAFFDQAELMHRMNRDLAAFNKRVVEAVCRVLTPDMVGLAEDMSYNRGPMLSRRHFRQFLLPYYEEIVPVLKAHGIPVFVDSDGDVTTMIPWLIDAGIEGVYPLERQAGVDLVHLRQEFPRFLLMGGYDKMVMSRGESAMRLEFERLLPVMRSGGFIPSVDHQTPPGVSLDNYRTYLTLFKEYTTRAAQEDGVRAVPISG